jgi:iron complex outermembrane receptor protein
VPMPSVATFRRSQRLVAGCIALACASEIHAAESAGLEEIVVTAARRQVPALHTPLSIGRVGADDLLLVGATHSSEVLNRIPGVMIQRGSGQESLTAIRSPVLTGAGSCGAFLFLENGVPIRPVGFCNVNEMLEINTEQADAIEVIRGTGSALYGSNALHGTVNVLQAAPADRPRFRGGVDLGPDHYERVKLAGRIDGDRTDFGAAGFYAHDGGWRDSSGFDEAKLSATVASAWDATPVRFDLAATDLAGLIEPAVPLPARLELRPYLRTSRMEFLQHFLLGQPLERNGQESAGLISTLAWDTSESWSAVAGADIEWAQSFLYEYQAKPTTGGSAVANAIRPQGRHYDYDVNSTVAALYGEIAYRFAKRWHASVGARAEYVAYDYDNQMIAGNTDENGVPCAFGGCLYSRPADRTDTFFNVAPKATLSVDITDRLSAYANASRGFRPPEMTELYRLQRSQDVASLDSEQLDAIEVGIKGSFATWRFALAAFDMNKKNVILRESNGYNVSNGRTSHRGVEYDLQWNAFDTLTLALGGTYAKHQYEFSRAIEGGESITKGNDIDTAPRELLRASLQWRPIQSVATEAEWLRIGDYWLDAANAHRYEGHELLNLRASWTIASEWTLALRLNNVLDRAYADRADYAFGTYRYFPGRGRTLFADFSWTVR